MTQQEYHMTAQQYARRIEQMLEDVQQECRIDMQQVSDDQARELFESVIQILSEAIRTLDEYAGDIGRGEFAQRTLSQPLSIATEHRTLRVDLTTEEEIILPAITSQEVSGGNQPGA